MLEHVPHGDDVKGGCRKLRLFERACPHVETQLLPIELGHLVVDLNALHAPARKSLHLEEKSTGTAAEIEKLAPLCQAGDRPHARAQL